MFWICVVTKHHFPPGSATQFFQIPHHPSVFCRSGLLVFLIIIGFHLFLPLVACNHLSLQYYMQITREEATTTRVSMSSLIGLLPFAELGVGRSKSLAWQWVSWWPTGMIWHVRCRLGEPVEAILSNYPWNGRLLGSRSWVGDIGRIMLAFYGDGLWGEFLLALAKRKKWQGLWGGATVLKFESSTPLGMSTQNHWSLTFTLQKNIFVAMLLSQNVC